MTASSDTGAVGGGNAGGVGYGEVEFHGCSFHHRMQMNTVSAESKHTIAAKPLRCRRDG